MNPQSDEEKRLQEEKYANALVQMANLDMAMQSHHEKKPKHFLSRKKMIWIVFTIISTIIGLLLTPLNPFDGTSSPSSNSSGQTAQSLIDATQELQDANK